MLVTDVSWTIPKVNIVDLVTGAPYYSDGIL